MQTKAVNSLRKNGPELWKIAESFRVHLNNMHIAAILEKKNMKGTNHVVCRSGAPNEVFRFWFGRRLLTREVGAHVRQMRESTTSRGATIEQYASMANRQASNYKQILSAIKYCLPPAQASGSGTQGAALRSA